MADLFNKTLVRVVRLYRLPLYVGSENGEPGPNYLEPSKLNAPELINFFLLMPGCFFVFCFFRRPHYWDCVGICKLHKAPAPSAEQLCGHRKIRNKLHKREVWVQQSSELFSPSFMSATVNSQCMCLCPYPSWAWCPLVCLCSVPLCLWCSLAF